MQQAASSTGCVLNLNIHHHVILLWVNIAYTGYKSSILLGGNMQHLLVLYLIVSILPGIGALTVLSALTTRLRNRALTYYLIAYGSFTVSILINLTMFYLGINISKVLTYGLYVLIVIGIPFSILMHTMLPLAVNEATKPPGKRFIDGFIILVGFVELGLFFTPLLIQYSSETHSLIFGPIYPLSSIIESISILYSITMIIILRKNITDTTTRTYILTLIIIIAMFLPAIGHDQFFFFGVESINEVPIELILSPVFYMVLSTVTLLFGTRILKSTIKLERSVNESDQESTQHSLESKIQRLAESAGLSAREISIIPLISKGLGNKQIALELHISTKTVGNHIYNIFKNSRSQADMSS